MVSVFARYCCLKVVIPINIAARPAIYPLSESFGLWRNLRRLGGVIYRWVVKKRILFWLAIIVGLVALSGPFLPTDFAVERSIIINAPHGAINAYLESPKMWDKWSAWSSDRDPTIKFTYSGPEVGKDAKQEWTSKELGSGWLKISSSNAKTGVAYFVGFDKDAEPYRGTILLQRPPNGAPGVLVSWSMLGSTENNYLMRYLAFKLDDWIGADFEYGLNRLKEFSEADADAYLKKEAEAKAAAEALKTATTTTSTTSASVTTTATATPLPTK